MLAFRRCLGLRPEVLNCTQPKFFTNLLLKPATNKANVQTQTFSSTTTNPEAEVEPKDGPNDTPALPLRSVKGKSSENKVKHFVDWKPVTVCAGHGGDGSISVRSEMYVEFAGVDGGDGGCGGHVILTATSRSSFIFH